MSSSHSVRFVHVSDLHLEQTLGGLPSVPNRLRDDFIDSPFQAAEKVFNAALDEKVDFLIMAGDVVGVETVGPRAIDFLLRQFQRLEESRITVYWAGGEVDDLDLWPNEIPLPSLVHRFPVGSIVEYSFQRKDRCVATIRGQSYRSGQNFRPADFSIRGEGAARIAVAFAPEIEPRNLRGQSVDYWALGGRHQATDLVQEAGVARYCGSPQGFCPDEPGPHSCTLVQIEHGRAHLKAIETDVVRWRKERIELAADADRRDLTQAIRHRLGELRPDRGELLTLVRWTVACDGSLGHELRNDHVCDAVLASLADAPGNAEMVSILIEPESRVISNDRFEEETILGDFLRKVRELEQDPNRVIDLIEYLPDTPGKQELASLVKLSSPSKRQHIFERVMSLGMDLLATDCEGTKA